MHITFLVLFCYFRAKDNQSALQLSISHRLQPVVDSLCKNGAEANVSDEHGNCPLWAALKSRQFEIAETLVNTICLVFVLMTVHSIEPTTWRARLLRDLSANVV